MRLWFAITCLLMLVLLPAAASSAATECSGTAGGTIQGDFDVPAGSSCSLAANTLIMGTTTVEGSLSGSGDELDGPLTAQMAGTVSLSDSALYGTVSTRGDSGATNLSNDSISGNLTINSQTGPTSVASDTVDGETSLDDNTGGVRVGSDVFDGDLECSSNDPAPQNSAASTIDGQAQGQCAGFASAPSSGAPAGNPPVATGPSPAKPATSPPTVIRSTGGRHHLRARILLTWHWRRSDTRLTGLAIIRPPARGRLTLTCRGPRCPARRLASASHRSLQATVDAYRGLLFHAGDVVGLTLRAPGSVPKRATLQIRASREPAIRTQAG